MQRKALHVIKLKFCDKNRKNFSIEAEVELFLVLPSPGQKLRVDFQLCRLAFMAKVCGNHSIATDPAASALAGYFAMLSFDCDHGRFGHDNTHPKIYRTNRTMAYSHI